VSEVFEFDPGGPGAEEALRAATAAVEAGGLVVLPTDTVYGIATRPDDPRATGRLFAAKRRPRGLNLPVLAGTTEAAFDLATPSEAARRLAAEFWPGPLTLVLPRSARSVPWSLGDHAETIGVRVPDHPIARLLTRTGPLATSSANLSGGSGADDPPTIREAFGDQVRVYLFTAAEAAPRGRSGATASTVVDLSGGEPRILRGGWIGPRDVERVTGLAVVPE
jgi:tRNA threonylcarbamoyl adenosine modification protein (Sua5/YciO/YrdC/YwlC family)